MQVFDSDAHWIEMEGDLIRRAELRRPRVMPRDGWDRTLAGQFPEQAPTFEQRMAFMQEHGIQAAAVHPTRCLSLGMIPEADVAVKIAEAFHEYSLEQVALAPPNTLFPIAMAVPQHIKHTASMVAEYKAAGFKGVMIHPHGHSRLLGTPEFFPFYEACVAADLAVTIHPNSFGSLATEGYTTFAEVHCLSFPLGLIRQFISMTMGGVFERYPQLRVAFLEAGAGWMPYWINRMDDEFAKRHAELPIQQQPSSMLQQAQVYVSCGEVEPELEAINATLGGGVLWQSDYPHWDHCGKESITALTELLPAALRQQIFWDNALACYGVSELS